MQKKKVTIAIVEDHLLMRECTNFRCSMLGYQVVMEAENGQNLLDKLESAEAPDICLLDINMPEMNGFETIVHLKKNWPNMRVLFLSMHNDRAYLKKSMELGADGFIAKDAPVDQLKSMLMSLTTTTTTATAAVA